MRDKALIDVTENANEFRYKIPTISMATLIEEFAEAILASRGKHEHPLRVELVQIAGVAINLIRKIDDEEEEAKKP